MNIFRPFFLLKPLLLLILMLIVVGCTSTYNSSTSQGAASGRQQLRVGVSTNSPPMVFKKGNVLQGLEIDLARQLGTYLNRDVVFVELAWDKQIPALQSSKIDIIMSGMTITEQRQYQVAFSEPYLQSGQMIMVRTREATRYSQGIYDVMGRSPAIGVITGTTGDFFITQNINRANLTRYKVSGDAVKALANGEIDVFVHDTPIICDLAANYKGAQLTPILQMFTDEYLAWAVTRRNTSLLEKVNQFVEQEKQSNRLQATIHRWIPYL